MSGKKRKPYQNDGFRGFHDGPRPILHRGGPGPLPPYPAVLEEELEYQHRDIQRILSENRHVNDENVILQRDLNAVKDEIHRLEEVIPKLRAERETQTRDLYERRLMLEDEHRAAGPLRVEVMQLRAEAQKLNASRHDLSAQVHTLTKDIARLKAENKQLIAMRTDMDEMRKELAEARRVLEYEKKANEEQMEHKQAMEKNLVSIAHEIEKLRAEQLTAARSSRGHGAGGYGTLNGSPERRYSGSTYSDIYGGRSWAPYDNRGPPRR